MRYLLSIILCLWASSAWAFPPGFIGAVTQVTAAPSGLTMPDGSECFYAATSTGNSENYITDNAIITDNQTNWYLRIRLHVASISGLDTNEMNRVVHIGGTRSTYNGIIITNDSGVYNLRMGYYNTAGRISAGYTLTVGETLDIEMHIQGGVGWELRVNGSTIDSATDASVSGDFDYLRIGNKMITSSISPYSNDGYAQTVVYMDCVDVTTTGWLGTGCTATGNLLSERFEATEYDVAWTETLGTNGTLDGDSTGP